MYVLSALATLLDYSYLPSRIGPSTPEALAILAARLRGQPRAPRRGWRGAGKPRQALPCSSPPLTLCSRAPHACKISARLCRRWACSTQLPFPPVVDVHVSPVRSCVCNPVSWCEALRPAWDATQPRLPLGIARGAYRPLASPSMPAVVEPRKHDRARAHRRRRDAAHGIKRSKSPASRHK